MSRALARTVPNATLQRGRRHARLELGAPDNESALVARIPVAGHHDRSVTKLCIFVGTTLGGYAGWAIGDALGFGLGWAFGLSGIGSLAGVYAGWKLARKLEE